MDKEQIEAKKRVKKARYEARLLTYGPELIDLMADVFDKEDDGRQYYITNGWKGRVKELTALIKGDLNDKMYELE